MIRERAGEGRRAGVLVILVAVAGGLALGVPAAAADQWFHLVVEDLGRGETEVRLNLPLSMVERLIPAIPEHHRYDHRVRLGEAHLDRQEVLDLIRGFRQVPPGERILVEVHGARVEAWRLEDGQDLHLLITDRRRDEPEVTVRMPLAVVEALVAGAGDEVDLVGALHALAESPQGGHVLVEDRDGTTEVRLWIDERSEEPR